MADDFIEARRRRASTAWDLKNEIILIGAGMPIGIPGGMDQTFPYRPHPEYDWLTGGRTREGGVLAFDPQEGWTLFEPPVTEMERIWGGSEAPIGKPIEDLEPWLNARSGRKLAWLGSAKDGEGDEEFAKHARTALTHARRSKDEHEIQIIREAVAATQAGHGEAARAIRPGVTERQVQIEIEAAFFRAGGDAPGYGTIVGSGPNSAVFHFTPGARVIQPNELVLVDAGASVRGYTADVTRTYPSSGKFTADQQWLYDAVLKAELLAVQACSVGAEWLDIHRLAAHSLAQSLVEAGLLTCSAGEAVESEAISLFFAHGIGHMVGLGVRDASGPLPDRAGDRKVAGLKIRMDLPLEAGYFVTIEPGLYFVPALLQDEKRREKHKHHVNWKAVDPWVGQGGVRIEDNVLVTEKGPVNLTEEILK